MVAESLCWYTRRFITCAALPLHEKTTRNVCFMQQVHKAISSIHSWLIKGIQRMAVSLKHYVSCPFPFEHSFENVTNISWWKPIAGVDSLSFMFSESQRLLTVSSTGVQIALWAPMAVNTSFSTAVRNCMQCWGCAAAPAHGLVTLLCSQPGHRTARELLNSKCGLVHRDLAQGQEMQGTECCNSCIFLYELPCWWRLNHSDILLLLSWVSTDNTFASIAWSRIFLDSMQKHR